MWAIIWNIAWAQWRVARNHLPRNGFGTIWALSLALLWYGAFGVLAGTLAMLLPRIPISTLRASLGAALLGIFFFWQLVPLLTLAGGWSLDLSKLRVYPLSVNTLLVTEAILRITSSGEVLTVLLGAIVGLLLNPAVPSLAAFSLLLYIPFNLLIALLIRELFLHSFARSRFREILTVFFLCAAVLPQTALRFGWFQRGSPYILAVANYTLAPWHAVAQLSLGEHCLASLLLIAAWIGAAYYLTHRQFKHSLRDENLLYGTSAKSSHTGAKLDDAMEWLSQRWADPIAALVTKELRSLVRMPRFRVVFTLASVFSVIVLIGLASGAGKFVGRNLVPLMNLYGLLVLGDALMWNIFGFDRGAAQLYFAAPIAIKQVFYAKNIIAAVFVAGQTCSVIFLVLLLRIPLTPMSLLTAVASVIVVGTFYVAVGNLSSVTIPRAANPKATMKTQAGIIQLWILGFTVGALVLLGFANLAGWAANTPWATIGTLAFEFILAVICYHLALDSAVERALKQQETLLADLSKGSAPIST